MICRVALIAYGVIYLLALGVMIVGSFGLFGVQADGLAAVFLIMIGEPWINLALPLVDTLGGVFGMIFATLAPLINLLLIGLLCGWWRNRKAKAGVND